MEHIYRHHFGGGKGLLDARVGYIGGNTENPSYRAVCSGSTGRLSPPPPSFLSPASPRPPYTNSQDIDAEALQVLYDPSVVSYERLVEFFFRMHDPTTANRQGPDVGSQYRSAIFYHSPEQEAGARKILGAVEREWFAGKSVATEVLPAGRWWDAEDYHQLYLVNSECCSFFLCLRGERRVDVLTVVIDPGGYECPSHHVRNFPELSVL